MRKYYLLTANISEDDNYFDELCENYKTNSNHIYWKTRRIINEDDICLIYYNNLRDGTSRVLFIGKVEKPEPSSNTHSTKDEKYIKMSLYEIDNNNIKYDKDFRNKFKSKSWSQSIYLIESQKIIDDINRQIGEKKQLSYHKLCEIVESVNTKYFFLKANMNHSKNRNSYFNTLNIESENEKGVIYWNIMMKNKVHNIMKGDKCLVYYANLPDLSNRILYYADVIESDYPNNIKSNKSIIDENVNDESSLDEDIRNNKFMKLSVIPVCLNDKNKYSKKILEEKYGINTTTRSKFALPFNHDLIKDIKDDIKGKKRSIKGFCQMFNDGYCICEFKNDKNAKESLNRSNHDTFVEENGFFYIDRHHLVERNLLQNSKIKNIDKIVNEDYNIFHLCPTCHKQIHHGKKEVKRYMINHLYNKEKASYDKFFENNKDDKELMKYKSALEWLYSIYKCS